MDTHLINKQAAVLLLIQGGMADVEDCLDSLVAIRTMSKNGEPVDIREFFARENGRYSEKEILSYLLG